MSLTDLQAQVADLGFPRVSGDEPAADARIKDLEAFSPRERG